MLTEWLLLAAAVAVLLLPGLLHVLARAASTPRRRHRSRALSRGPSRFEARRLVVLRSPDCDTEPLTLPYPRRARR